MPFETALYQWQQGERRLNAAPPERKATLERVVQALVAELRRRRGGRFTTEELVDLYEAGTTWCLQVAMSLAPEDPWAWEAGVVVDAAFGRYLREAADYAGGRRHRRVGDWDGRLEPEGKRYPAGLRRWREEEVVGAGDRQHARPLVGVLEAVLVGAVAAQGDACDGAVLTAAPDVGLGELIGVRLASGQLVTEVLERGEPKPARARRESYAGE